jgi:hypothetical protein
MGMLIGASLDAGIPVRVPPSCGAYQHDCRHILLPLGKKERTAGPLVTSLHVEVLVVLAVDTAAAPGVNFGKGPMWIALSARYPAWPGICTQLMRRQKGR